MAATMRVGKGREAVKAATKVFTTIDNKVAVAKRVQEQRDLALQAARQKKVCLAHHGMPPEGTKKEDMCSRCQERLKPDLCIDCHKIVGEGCELAGLDLLCKTCHETRKKVCKACPDKVPLGMTSKELELCEACEQRLVFCVSCECVNESASSDFCEACLRVV